jgi:hypothetical protein
VPPKTASERRFERYAHAQGVPFVFEPDLGTHSNPDYQLTVGGSDVVCEVKEFKTTWLSGWLSPIGSADAGRSTQAVRTRVRRGAEQLAELAGQGMPLAIVLANPHQADVDLEPERVWAALYYDDGPLENNRADHVSAIVILHRRTAEQEWAEDNVRRLGPLEALRAAIRAEREGTTPRDETLYVTVLPAASPAAVALPAGVFDGPDDTVWRP